MNPYEEKIQKDLEDGQLPQGDALDVKAYRQVFQALAKEPEFRLSSSFAEKVAARVVSKQHQNQFRDYFWFVAGIFILGVSAVLTVLSTGFRLDFGFLNVMSDYKGLVLFASVFIAVLNWLDKKIVRRRHVHY